MFKRATGIILAFILALGILPSGAAAETDAEFTKTSYNFTKQMTVGINIGNTLDATGGETSWGCPKIERGLIQAIKAKGFDTIRLPVTWLSCTDDKGNFRDSRVFINRVKEVVDWIYDEGMYCIINTHHEMSWLRTWWEDENGDEDTERMEKMYAKLATLWTNIAKVFKDYGERLIFEGYNETRAGESVWGAVEDDHVVLQKIGQTFIDAVRATGGNNEKRYLLLATYAASFGVSEIKGYKMPTDPANHIIISVHCYSPYNFCFNKTQYTTFSESEFDSVWQAPITALKSRFLENGIGVILGEFGAVAKNNDSERVKYVQKLAKTCMEAGLIPIWWDNYISEPSASNEAFGIINRLSPYNWTADSVATALVETANEYSGSRPNYAGINKGDVNTDGTVDLADVRAIIGALASGEQLLQQEPADYNSDGKVNLSDVRALITDIASGVL